VHFRVDRRLAKAFLVHFPLTAACKLDADIKSIIEVRSEDRCVKLPLSLAGDQASISHIACFRGGH